ncbi:MAG TPA: oxygenase MpaB family protein, partial [Actinomycetota bacterium]
VVASGVLRVTEETLKVASLIRNPPPEVPWRPVLRQIAWWAFATLPQPLRSEYGIRWNPLKEARLRNTLFALKLMRPVIPATFREILPARLAEERLATRPVPERG